MPILIYAILVIGALILLSILNVMSRILDKINARVDKTKNVQKIRKVQKTKENEVYKTTPPKQAQGLKVVPKPIFNEDKEINSQLTQNKVTIYSQYSTISNQSIANINPSIIILPEQPKITNQIIQDELEYSCSKCGESTTEDGLCERCKEEEEYQNYLNDAYYFLWDE
jgi:hypothetical protein